ncbi:hypothetical protein V1512DRAFT_261931 [Lipomyces arxii]|uniref:uncharacterized protein n=1 Tax=Lipomyces arxii TaxID=56418 RepID=UPI0034CEF299
MNHPELYLRTLPAVRERTRFVLAKAEQNKLTNFDVDLSKFGRVVEYVCGIIRRDWGDDYSQIPPHGRAQQFDVGGVSRIEKLVRRWSGVDAREIARRLVDLYVVSVLIDAGAGNKWKFIEPIGGDAHGRNAYGRSEGLAVASLYMFESGLFSSDMSNPYQVDSGGLKSLKMDRFEVGVQSSDENLLAGVSGRAEILQRLGVALETGPKYFGASARPGNMLDYLQAPATTGTTVVSVLTVWDVIMNGFGPVWPKGRTTLNGVALGDAWECSSMPDGEEWEHIVPFHKLSQWLCYSILVPMEQYGGIKFIDKQVQTGLPEYRNGGLFVDTGVLSLKPHVRAQGMLNYDVLKVDKEDDDVPVFLPEDDVIVEWRAVTVGLLDMLLPAVNEKLGVTGTKDELILAQLLEAGSWLGGRELAARIRPGTRGPPIAIKSDGTLF